MDYEKKYKEALERAKDYHNDYTQDIMEDIFPELKESEDDKVRKKLIHLVKKSYEQGGYALHKWEADEMLAWLEKQSEQKPAVDTKVIIPKFRVGDIVKSKSQPMLRTRKIISIGKDCYWCEDRGCIGFAWEDNYEIVEQKPANKVEPKFKVGDYVVGKYISGYVSEVRDDCYLLDYQGFPIDKQDNYHLWTIQDAKDGDVLCTYECGKPKIVFMLKGAPKKPYVLGYHCYYNIIYPHFEFDSEKGCLAPNDEDVKPATKEQRELLFQKMKEKGYEWDADKLELKRIEQNPAWGEEDDKKAERIIRLLQEGYDENCIKSSIDWLINRSKSLRPQKSWSEEDEKLRLSLITDLSNAETDDKDVQRELNNKIDWLKSLKDRVQPQPKQEWSKEDESHIRYIIECLENCKKGVAITMTTSTAQGHINWLKSFKDRVQPKQEWSEEDEKKLETILFYLKASDYNGERLNYTEYELTDWLNSLKDRYTWKPSDGQMKALGVATNISNVPEKEYIELEKLYQDLEKLREG